MLWFAYEPQTKEGFQEQCVSVANKPIRSIRSKYVGIAVDVCSANGCSVGDISSDYLVLVKKNNTSQSLSVRENGTINLTIPNGNDKNQLWVIKEIKSAGDLTTLDNKIIPQNNVYPYHLVLAKNTLNKDTVLALHYENGNLAVRPLNDYHAQQWNVEYQPVVNNSISLVSSAEHAIFSPELDKSKESHGIDLDRMTDQMNSQSTSDLKEILRILKSQGKVEPPTTNSFGDKPLKISLNLGKGTNDVFGLKEPFSDNNDIGELLSKYENTNKTNKEISNWRTS